MSADVLAIDLPWGDASGRTAIASRSRAGLAVASVLGDRELVELVRTTAAPRALVLLDVPLDGCETLHAARPRRLIDDRFLAIGIPILPSVKSGDRGPALAKQLRAARPDVRLLEIYPYAVLRVLWAVRAMRRAFRFDDAIDVSRRWRDWPPKYKRAKTRAEKLEAMRSVASVLAAIPRFRSVTDSPPDDATTADLARRADRYDALLGLVAGIAAAAGSPWSWHARAAGDAGSILTIADSSIRRRFAEAEARVTKR